MSDHISHLDVVELDRSFGDWPAGSTGTVVDDFDGGVVVEMVAPSGRTLDLLDVPIDAVHVVVPHERAYRVSA